MNSSSVDIARKQAEAFLHQARDQTARAAAVPLAARLEAIRKLKAAVVTRAEAIMDRIQLETGKARTDALSSEIFSTLEFLDYVEKNAPKFLKDRSVATPLALFGKKSKVIFDPLGVVLIICPWNYPFFQGLVPIALSYVCGNVTVYKPSEHTPLKGVFEELLLEAGIPPSFVLIAYGEGMMGQALVTGKPDKIFFTGSTKTGRAIAKLAAENLTPVELELGGKDAMIVFAGANLKRAARAALWGGYTNCGQACTSVERLLVEQSIAAEFKSHLIRGLELIEQGTDRDGAAEVGQMAVDFQLSVVREHVEEARSKGATVVAKETWDGQSRKIPPMVIDGVLPDMKIWNEETFGPVLPLMTFSSEDEAIRLANHSRYGLSANVFGSDDAQLDRVTRALHVGNVSVNNVMLTEGNSYLPFGGVKESGIGRYKGEFGFYAFTNVKAVLVDKNSSKIEVNWYPYTPKKFDLFQAMTLSLFSRGLWSFLKFVYFGIRLEIYTAKLEKHLKR